MIFQLNDIEIDTKQFCIKQAGAVVPTEPKVFDTVVYLIQNRQRLISRDELFTEIWKDRAVSDTTLSNHIKSARKILGDDGERQHIIKTVRGRGYQFIAIIKEVPTEETPAVTVSAIASDNTTFNRKSSNIVKNVYKSPKNTATLIVTMFLLLTLVIAFIWLLGAFDTEVEQKPYVLVVPFSVSSHNLEKWQPFADQVTREFIQDLRKISGIRVVPPPSSFTFKANKIRTHIRAQLPEVNYVLDGVVSDGDDGNIRITVEFEDLKGGKLIWDRDFDLNITDTNRFNAQADIAASVSDLLKVAVLKEEKRALAEVPTSSLQAYELYVKGQYQFSLLTYESVKKSIELYSQAIELDPQFEEAYVAKANAYRIILNVFEKPKDVLPKVITSSIDILDVNPESAHARSSLGLAYVHVWLWDDAWKMLNEAKQRDSNIALTELGFALYYSAIGDFDGLKRALARADQLDPLNEELAEWGLWALMMGNQLDAASVWGENKLKLHPNNPYHMLGVAVLEYLNGNHQRSIALATKGVEMTQRSPFALIILAQAYAAAGQIDKIEPLVTEAQGLNEYMCPYETAMIYAILNDAETTFPLLDEAIHYRSNCLIFTRHDPRLSSLRSDLRYAKILETVGLDDKSVSGYHK